MAPDRDSRDIGEALFAAIGEHGARPPAVLRERIVARALRRTPGLAWRRPVVAGGLALAALVAAASLAWGLATQQALAEERGLVAQLREAASKDEVIFDVVDARNVNKTTLRAPNDDSPTAPYGKVFTRPDMPYIVAMAGRLSPAPSGEEYHLYLDDRRIGTIVPDESGFGYFVFRAPSVGISYTHASLVREAAQASAATGTLILASSR